MGPPEASGSTGWPRRVAVRRPRLARSAAHWRMAGMRGRQLSARDRAASDGQNDFPGRVAARARRVLRMRSWSGGMVVVVIPPCCRRRGIYSRRSHEH